MAAIVTGVSCLLLNRFRFTRLRLPRYQELRGLDSSAHATRAIEDARNAALEGLIHSLGQLYCQVDLSWLTSHQSRSKKELQADTVTTRLLECFAVASRHLTKISGARSDDYEDGEETSSSEEGSPTGRFRGIDSLFLPAGDLHVTICDVSLPPELKYRFTIKTLLGGFERETTDIRLFVLSEIVRLPHNMWAGGLVGGRSLAETAFGDCKRLKHIPSRTTRLSSFSRPQWNEILTFDNVGNQSVQRLALRVSLYTVAVTRSTKAYKKTLAAVQKRVTGITNGGERVQGRNGSPGRNEIPGRRRPPPPRSRALDGSAPDASEEGDLSANKRLSERTLHGHRSIVAVPIEVRNQLNVGDVKAVKTRLGSALYPISPALWEARGSLKRRPSHQDSSMIGGFEIETHSITLPLSFSDDAESVGSNLTSSKVWSPTRIPQAHPDKASPPLPQEGPSLTASPQHTPSSAAPVTPTVETTKVGRALSTLRRGLTSSDPGRGPGGTFQGTITIRLAFRPAQFFDFIVEALGHQGGRRRKNKLPRFQLPFGRRKRMRPNGTASSVTYSVPDSFDAGERCGDIDDKSVDVGDCTSLDLGGGGVRKVHIVPPPSEPDRVLGGHAFRSRRVGAATSGREGSFVPSLPSLRERDACSLEGSRELSGGSSHAARDEERWSRVLGEQSSSRWDDLSDDTKSMGDAMKARLPAETTQGSFTSFQQEFLRPSERDDLYSDEEDSSGFDRATQLTVAREYANDAQRGIAP